METDWKKLKMKCFHWKLKAETNDIELLANKLSSLIWFIKRTKIVNLFPNMDENNRIHLNEAACDVISLNSFKHKQGEKSNLI